MRVERGWLLEGKPAVKITVSAHIDAEEFDRIIRIAKKQDWDQKRIGEYIAENGWQVFGDRWFSCDEEYDDQGNQIEQEEERG